MYVNRLAAGQVAGTWCRNTGLARAIDDLQFDNLRFVSGIMPVGTAGKGARAENDDGSTGIFTGVR